MTYDLIPARQFMKQYNFTEVELQYVRKRNKRAVVIFEGQFFVNIGEIEASFKSEEIFLCSI